MATKKQPTKMTKKPTIETGSEVAVFSGAELDSVANRYDAREVLRQASAVAVTGGGWPFLSVRNGIFRLLEETLGKVMDAIVLFAVRENSYFEGTWDPQNISPPTCQAVARVGQPESEMAPPEALGDARQNEQCGLPKHPNCCPQNEFGSKPGRGGKACNNTIRLALLNSSILDGDVPTPCLARVSATSMRPWSLYQQSLAKMPYKKNGKEEVLHLPTYAVITEMSMVDGRGNAPFGWGFRALKLLNEPQSVIVRAFLKEAEAEVTRVQISSSVE